MKKQQLESKSSDEPLPAETVASCDDLLREFFVRLPLKPLVRSKSVCKQWNSLISDPNLHLARNRHRRPEPAVGLICQPHPTATSFAYIVPFDKSASVDCPKLPANLTADIITIVHSCNGLLLLRSEEEPRHHFVFNPTTTECTKLPEVKESTGGTTRAMCLAYDPSKSPHYKVVHAARNSIKQQYRFEVYSTEKGSWGNSIIMDSVLPILDLPTGAYWNGAVHWFSVSSDKDSVYIDLDEDHESTRGFPTPPLPHSELASYSHRVHEIEHIYYFGESSGHLHFVGHAVIEEYPMDPLKVYEMRRDYSEWFLKFKIGGDVIRHPSVICALQVRAEEDDDCFVVFRRGGTIFRYNIVCETLETLHDLTSHPRSIKTSLPYFDYICFA